MTLSTVERRSGLQTTALSRAPPSCLELRALSNFRWLDRFRPEMGTLFRAAKVSLINPKCHQGLVDRRLRQHRLHPLIGQLIPDRARTPPRACAS